MIPTVISDHEDVLKAPQISQINIEIIIKSVKFAVASYSNFFLFRYIQYPVTGSEVPIRAAIKVMIFENIPA
ncbi:hypothetical protein HMPREF1205_01564 [Bacteroides fragilis HMW 616]|nr:hypothetical protein HMPREF1205_01564 [Bacteroides fragilis HMW 616]